MFLFEEYESLAALPFNDETFRHLMTDAELSMIRNGRGYGNSDPFAKKPLISNA